MLLLSPRDPPASERLDGLGIPHSGIKDENGGPLLTLRDPDNIQIELHAFDPALVRL
jgi:hypothetical protein